VKELLNGVTDMRLTTEGSSVGVDSIWSLRTAVSTSITATTAGLGTVDLGMGNGRWEWRIQLFLDQLLPDTTLTYSLKQPALRVSTF
jgi:hypothetical protein